jgi:ABC-type phosphate transport system permease subunit
MNYHKNLKDIYVILVIGAILAIFNFLVSVSVFFDFLRFQERMLEYSSPHARAFFQELNRYAILTLLFQLLVTLIHASFPVITHFKLKKLCERDEWDSIRSWIKFMGGLLLVGALSLLFLIPLSMGGFGAISQMALAMIIGITLLLSLKHLK